VGGNEKPPRRWGRLIRLLELVVQVWVELLSCLWMNSRNNLSLFPAISAAKPYANIEEDVGMMEPSVRQIPLLNLFFVCESAGIYLPTAFVHADSAAPGPASISSWMPEKLGQDKTQRWKSGKVRYTPLNIQNSTTKTHYLCTYG